MFGNVTVDGGVVVGKNFSKVRNFGKVFVVRHPRHQPFNQLPLFDAQNEMKMVGHQTISKGFCHRRQIQRILLQKVMVICFVQKQIFKTIAVVEDVVRTFVQNSNHQAYNEMTPSLSTFSFLQQSLIIAPSIARSILFSVENSALFIIEVAISCLTKKI